MRKNNLNKVIEDIVNNAEKCRNNPTDFACLHIDGKEYFLTTEDQIKCAVEHANKEKNE